MARSQEVEELFEEILRTNPQNHYTLNEPLQAHKYPAIPPNSASSRLMHPLELPQTTKASVLPPPPSAVRHTPSRIQYHTRQEHEVHVHADQYAENRSAAMHATPSSRPEYSKYNYGGYIPQVMIMTKHPDCNFDDYLSFVQRNPTDFLVFTPTITVIKDVVIPTPLVTSMTSPYLQGFWQPSTVQSMTISPYADRFQRVCRRLECNLNWTEMMKMSEDEVHAIAKQFEKIARCILQREQRLAQWIRYEYAHCHPARFWSEGSAARLEETKQRDDWLELLRSDEHKVKNALQELKKLHYHSPVMYRGQVYLDKMNHDKLDLLHQLTRFEK
ncbi:hypothetical protein HMI55_002950 [Coelomomyces lativittatus]|nr:hypothetical protein HMI55_002950 [Coelomomyces lativittatus]